jgi:hypothetical protein
VAHGTENWRYYDGKKACCLCHVPEEDWMHILACPSIDASMNMEESWKNVWKAMAYLDSHGKREALSLSTFPTHI